MRILLVFLMILPCFSGYSQTWTPISTGTSVTLRSVFFVDNNNGFAGGASKTLVKTSNGGNTWQDVALPTSVSGTITGICFSDPQTGFISVETGTESLILKSTDGGVTWNTSASMAGSAIRSLVCKQDQILMSGTNGRIIYSENGGNTYNISIADTSVDLYSSAILSSQELLVAGEQGNIYKSIDGGNNWQSKTSGLIQDILSLQFVDGLGYLSGENGRLARSTDEGETWQLLSSGTSRNLNSLFFLTANEGFAVGDKGAIITTADSGTTWTTQFAGSTWDADLFSVHFPSGNRGFTVGDVDNFQTGESLVKRYNRPVSVKENTLFSEIFVYPNPVRDRIFINPKINSLKFSPIYLTDLMGRRFFLQFDGDFSSGIPIPDTMPDGIYFLNLMESQQQKNPVFRIFIKR